MNWVNKQKLPTIEAIKYNNQPCLTLDSLWNTLYSSFNTTIHRQINIEVLDEISNKLMTLWNLFFKDLIGSFPSINTLITTQTKLYP